MIGLPSQLHVILMVLCAPYISGLQRQYTGIFHRYNGGAGDCNLSCGDRPLLQCLSQYMRTHNQDLTSGKNCIVYGNDGLSLSTPIPQSAVWVEPDGRTEKYFIIVTQVSWTEAVRMCKSHGAMLAEFSTLDELEQFREKAYKSTAFGLGFMYVGGRQKESDIEKYKWHSTGQVIPNLSTWWHENEPNNPDEKCVAESFMSDYEKMCDIPCATSLWVPGFICEV